MKTRRRICVPEIVREMEAASFSPFECYEDGSYPFADSCGERIAEDFRAMWPRTGWETLSIVSCAESSPLIRTGRVVASKPMALIATGRTFRYFPTQSELRASQYVRRVARLRNPAMQDSQNNANQLVSMTRYEFETAINRAADEARRTQWGGFFAGLLVLFIGVFVGSLVVRDQIRVGTENLQRRITSLEKDLKAYRSGAALPPSSQFVPTSVSGIGSPFADGTEIPLVPRSKRSDAKRGQSDSETATASAASSDAALPPIPPTESDEVRLLRAKLASARAQFARNEMPEAMVREAERQLAAAMRGESIFPDPKVTDGPAPSGVHLSRPAKIDNDAESNMTPRPKSARGVTVPSPVQKQSRDDDLTSRHRRPRTISFAPRRRSTPGLTVIEPHSEDVVPVAFETSEAVR